MIILPYSSELKQDWDRVVASARNSVFQHFRDYMDYHSDRFCDCSVMAQDSRGRFIAALPAHSVGDTVCSHRGLTFGGWIMTDRCDMLAMMEIWTAMTEYYKSLGFKKLYYRPAPYIYHRYPADEDIYALSRAGGNIDSCQVASVVDLHSPLGFDMAYRQSVRKAVKAGVDIEKSNDYAAFWQILEELLCHKHDATPVHTIGEIELLHDRFPDNIVLYTAKQNDELLAGVVMYYCGNAAHSQYTATTEHGRQQRVLPLMYQQIMEDAKFRGVRYFDFGTSNLDSGRILNEGLVRQKCSFGARAVAYTAYILSLNS